MPYFDYKSIPPPPPFGEKETPVEKKSRPSAPTKPAVATAIKSGDASSLGKCAAPYEKLGPKLYGTFHGGDNLQDVLCKLEAIRKKSGTKFATKVQWMKSKPNLSPCKNGQSCTIKVGALGDFGEKINSQYINMVDYPNSVEAGPFVIGNLNFNAEFLFDTGWQFKELNGYPIYRLKNGKRAFFTKKKSIKTNNGVKTIPAAITTEHLYEINFYSTDGIKIANHRRDELLTKLDNAFLKKGYLKDKVETSFGVYKGRYRPGKGGYNSDSSYMEIKYLTSDEIIKQKYLLGSSKGYSAHITYTFGVNMFMSIGWVDLKNEGTKPPPTLLPLAKIAELFASGEKRKLDKNVKKDTGDL